MPREKSLTEHPAADLEEKFARFLQRPNNMVLVKYQAFPTDPALASLLPLTSYTYGYPVAIDSDSLSIRYRTGAASKTLPRDQVLDLRFYGDGEPFRMAELLPDLRTLMMNNQ